MAAASNAWCHGGPGAFLATAVAGLLVCSACRRLHQEKIKKLSLHVGKNDLRR